MGDKKYCICCGEEVPYYVIERDQKKEYACSFCGFTLEVLKLWEEEDNLKTTQKQEEKTEEPDIKKEEIQKEAGEKKDVSSFEKETGEAEEKKVEPAKEEINSIWHGGLLQSEETSFQGETKDAKTEVKGSIIDSADIKNKKVKTSFEDRDSIKLKIPESPERDKDLLKEEKTKAGTYAIVAEDSEFLRTLLKELIIKKSLSDNVIAVSNGIELVAEYTRIMNERSKINFAIIDLNMPEMDGLTAVRTIRVLEDRNNIKRVPVVFFSAVKADEALRKQMDILEPAHYINKGVSPSPQALAERVEVLLHFLTYRYTRP